MWEGAFGLVFRTDGPRRWCCAALRTRPWEEPTRGLAGGVVRRCLLGLLQFVSALPGVGLRSKTRLGYAPFGRVGTGIEI